MALDLHLTIAEDSPAGQAVLQLVSEQRITPEQAATRILSEAAYRTPADEMIGAFSSAEDSAILDAAMEHIRELRRTEQLRDFGQ